MALLLYLIRKEEMDIMDIKVHEITAQYLDYIKLMKELDVEVAGEFISMAATLIHIKSRMLLPQYNENGEIVESEDPRKELVQKLMEYQKYQEAAKLLADRPWVGRDVFLRGSRERLEGPQDDIELEENALFSLISAYRASLKAAKKRVHRVVAKTQSIASRILEIKDRLIVGMKTTLAELANSAENRGRQTLITFLSLLELGKLGFVGLSQTEPYSDLWITTKKPIETDALARVEEYDNLHSADVAEQMVLRAATTELDDEEFILKDSVDSEEPDEAAIAPEEMASDEELAAAESEMRDHDERA